MCRLLAMYSTRNNMGMARIFLNAFINSNKYDPYLEKASGGRLLAHDDGWGIIAIGYVNDTPSVVFNKTLNPIFDEYSKRLIELIINRVEGYDEVYLLIHARKASRKEPYGAEYLHPFVFLMENGAMWFVHNGGADKERLARQLSVYPWIRVDSELLGYFIMSRVGECVERLGDVDKCSIEAYKLAKEYVVDKSALNTGLLFIQDKETRLYVTHWVKGIVENDLRDYYLLVKYVSSGFVAIGSISIAEYLVTSIKKDLEIVEPGIYRVSGNEVLMIEKL